MAYIIHEKNIDIYPDIREYNCPCDISERAEPYSSYRYINKKNNAKKKVGKKSNKSFISW